MEDGPDGITSTTLTNNGEIHSVMANFPEADVEQKSPLVNGKDVTEVCSDENADSSDCDALVIDEGIKPKLTKIINSNIEVAGFRGFDEGENYTPSKVIHAIFKEQFNNFINVKEKFKKDVKKITFNSDNNKQCGATDTVKKSENVNLKTNEKKKSNPKLREYAQYLGLQPTVQFKCSKCSLSGFPSLTALNEHLIQCKSRSPVTTQPVLTNTNNTPSTNIRVTRKVFLCSACGTYYENWNLFLHIREVHKRFICLYCLGMFSHSEKLSLHLISKHNCNPNNNINSLEDFFNIYKDPCFLMCCDCQKVFTERDNFFNHVCPEGSQQSNEATKAKVLLTNKNSQQKIAIEHVTADSYNYKTDTNFAKYDESIGNNSLSSTNAINSRKDVLADSFENFETALLVSKDISNTIPSDSCNDINKKSNDESGSSAERTAEHSGEERNFETLNTSVRSLDSAEETIKDMEDNSHKSPPHITNYFHDDKEAESRNEANINGDGEEHIEEDNFQENLRNHELVEERIEEVRKVPKVTLKLPKQITYEEEKDFSDDSEKLMMEVDEGECEAITNRENVPILDEEEMKQDTSIQIAGVDVPIVELELEQPLDKFNIKILLQKCLGATIPTCVYCNHARKIAVNGKQLALHAIAEHRYSAIVNSITAEELIPESFVTRLKESLLELDDAYFNLESTADEAITFSHIFECFQCRFTTTIHKELYLHNRKMHAKSILLCIMCKSNFYSYSELICHLCPGVYIDLKNDIHFRCCLCVGDELPSAFRLMVHLRKRHHACDVCLELCHSQSRLSNHVWKHKLHHLCYRCGIAYRNKPDITKHLFWKHGTESVLCKKCLQKKWPHVYHFCIPPSLFECDECNLSFSRSVSLRVHKRIHTDQKPHSCTFEGCTEKFISKKLLLKHDFKHREPEPTTVEEVKVESEKEIKSELESEEQVAKDDALPEQTENVEKTAEKPSKPKVDVYDLPALNLSESDTSDSEDEAKNINKEQESNAILESSLLLEPSETDDKLSIKSEATEQVDAPAPVPILENIWDDFKNYQANKEKLDNNSQEEKLTDTQNDEPDLNVILNDHDYCARTSDEMIEEKTDVDTSVDHDYCTQPATTEPSQTEQETKVSNSPKKKGNTSSDSSSDSDSSSCTCGSNCSCSSSSGSSSSSSDSSDSDSSTEEGRRRQQQAKRERKKEKAKNKNNHATNVNNIGNAKENETVDVTATENLPQLSVEAPIHESDLETTESDTDEEFYDKHPQKLASKLFEEKRNQLMLVAGLGPCLNGSTLETSRPPTPNLPDEVVKSKKKAKYKKRKKKKSSKYGNGTPRNSITTSVNDYSFYQDTTPAVSMSIKNSPVTTPAFNSPIHTSFHLPAIESDSNLRSSKRKRVPNKFYGYSSDEENEKAQSAGPKWRKVDLPSPRSPMIVPPITIKTIQPPPPPPPPPIEPISIRATSNPGELRIEPARNTLTLIRPTRRSLPNQDSGSDSNESSADEDKPPVKEQPALYCYCRCPYDEVSEMIGCDSNDCAIEWFHFECVGIMVPPKGQWFCPDCRKKKQQKRELLQKHHHDQQQQPHQHHQLQQPLQQQQLQLQQEHHQEQEAEADDHQEQQQLLLQQHQEQQ